MKLVRKRTPVKRAPFRELPLMQVFTLRVSGPIHVKVDIDRHMCCDAIGKWHSDTASSGLECILLESVLTVHD